MSIVYLGEFIPIDLDKKAKSIGIEFGVMPHWDNMSEEEYENIWSDSFGIKPNDNPKTKNRWSVTGYNRQALNKKDAKKFKEHMNKKYPNAAEYLELGIGYFVKNGKQLRPSDKVTYYNKCNFKPKNKHHYNDELEWIITNLEYWQLLKDNYTKKGVNT